MIKKVDPTLKTVMMSFNFEVNFAFEVMCPIVGVLVSASAEDDEWQRPSDQYNAVM
jgi:hypothetical protein